MIINKVNIYNNTSTNTNFKSKSDKFCKNVIRDSFDKSNSKFCYGFLGSLVIGVPCLLNLSACYQQHVDHNKTKDIVFKNITDAKTGNKNTISPQNEIAFKDAMEFYNKNKSTGTIVSNKNLINFIGNSTLYDSDGGCTITEKEKNLYFYAKKNSINIPSRLEEIEKEINMSNN